MEIKSIHSTTLNAWLLAGKRVTVLDIRKEMDSADRQIPNRVHYNIIDQLKSGDSTALDGLTIDENIPVITVCNGGKASAIAA
ncbi:MAG: rhodanese-like domain-containing protein, partial [Flavobacteriales bacterium]|nr:rhodanese-like domain-containing protein [Flavobacteriales bacterium]